MENLISVIPSLVLTSLGALISLLCTMISDSKNQKAERMRSIFEKKLAVYRLISEFIVTETQNNENRNLKTYTPISTNHLVHSIEIDMQLWVSSDIRKLFYSAYESIQAELPFDVVQARLDNLGIALQQDIQKS